MCIGEALAAEEILSMRARALGTTADAQQGLPRGEHEHREQCALARPRAHSCRCSSTTLPQICTGGKRAANEEKETEHQVNVTKKSRLTSQARPLNPAPSTALRTRHRRLM